jgi:hypothetical protein
LTAMTGEHLNRFIECSGSEVQDAGPFNKSQNSALARFRSSLLYEWSYFMQEDASTALRDQTASAGSGMGSIRPSRNA